MNDQANGRPLVIFVIVNNPVDNKRLGIARALRAAGHVVHGCSKSSYAEIAAEFAAVDRRRRVDVILTFSWSFIHCGGRPFDPSAFKAFWQGVATPVAVMWDDNPLRWHKILAVTSGFAPGIRHFVIDSTVAERLRGDGIDAVYFPIYYADPAYMTSEQADLTPDADVLLCGNVADTGQFFQLLPGAPDPRHRVARAFLERKRDDEAYVDELDFLAGQGLDLKAVDQPQFLAILTGIQRTVDRTRILARIPAGIRVGLVGHNLSAPEIPDRVVRYPGVSHAAIGHLYALPIVQFGTSGWPAACNLRLFQAAAMGGIMLHEDRPDARRHFAPEAESLFYRDTDHLAALLEDTLAHRERYDAAAAATHRRFHDEHTIAHRARELAGHLAAAPSGPAAG